MDSSTIDTLLKIRKKAFEDNPEISIGRELFSSLLNNPNAAVATMKTGDELAGYVVANPIREGWVNEDLNEIKETVKAGMDGAPLFKKISNAIDSGPCYYLDDLAISKRGMGTTGMMRGFFSQLDEHSAEFLVLHGRMANGAYKSYTKLIEMNGYKKIHECIHPNWFGGEDFMLMVFEKV